jgi:tetratricopeptide (TPR) repeat protein
MVKQVKIYFTMKLEGLKNWLSTAAMIFITTATFAQTGEEISAAIRKEDYANAEALSKKWMTADPKNADAYFYLGETYYEQEKFAEAAEAYNKGLALNDDAWLCNVGVAKTLLDQNKTADATKLVDKVLRKTRNKNAAAFYQVAKAYLTSQNPNPDKAIEYITRSQELDSKTSIYNTLMGDAYVVKKEYGKAVSQYEFASDKNKKDPDNYVKRAILWKNGKVYNEAEKALDACLAIDPNYAPAIKELTEVYAKNGQRAKVLPLLKRYNELVGSDVASRMRYIRYLCGYAGDYEGTLKEAAIFSAANPTNIEIYRWVAWANAKLGDKAKEEKADAAVIADYYKKAIDNSKMFLDKRGDKKVYLSDYENYMSSAINSKDFATAEVVYPQLLAMDSTKTNYYEDIAKGYYEAKNYEKAIPAYRTKVAKTKGTATDYSYIGLCYKAQKNYADADAAFAKSCELNDKYIYAYAQRAQMAEIQDPELTTAAAKPHYENIIAKGDPAKNKKDFYNAYKYLGYYYVKNNDNAMSLTNFQKAFELDSSDANISQNIATLQAALGTASPVTTPATGGTKN